LLSCSEGFDSGSLVSGSFTSVLGSASVLPPCTKLAEA
jgi:hypothetical protein